AGLLSEEDEVGVLWLERRRKHAGGAHEIGARSRVVRDQKRSVCAHRERLPDAVLRALRAHGDDENLAALSILDPQRLLDRVRVEGVDRTFAGAVEPLRIGIDSRVSRALGHVFDTDGDLHGERTLIGRRAWFAPRTLLGSCASSANRSEGSQHMSGHRTTARAILLVATLGLLAGQAAAIPDPGRAPKRNPAGKKEPPPGKRINFPNPGKFQFSNDFGDPRPQGSHEGIDIVAPRKALALAAEAGRVKFHIMSARAGCMLYLYADSGTTYIYIHLNNDLGMTNDNRGRCAPGIAFAPGLKSGARVVAGGAAWFRRG